MAAVDANTGEFVTFDQTNTSFDDIPESCGSSGSIPVFFIPQKFKGHILMDGGTVWDVNIDSAVNQCLNMGYPEDKIILDVLVCGYIPELDQ